MVDVGDDRNRMPSVVKRDVGATKSHSSFVTAVVLSQALG